MFSPYVDEDSRHQHRVLFAIALTSGPLCSTAGSHDFDEGNEVISS